MAGDTGRLHTQRGPQLGQRILQSENGGLCVLSFIQQRGVITPHDGEQRLIQFIAHQLRDFIQRVFEHREARIQILPHTGELSTLSGEHKGDFGGVGTHIIDLDTGGITVFQQAIKFVSSILGRAGQDSGAMAEMITPGGRSKTHIVPILALQGRHGQCISVILQVGLQRIFGFGGNGQQLRCKLGGGFFVINV